MEPSTYQNLKMALLAELHLSRDALHLYIGLACLVLFALLSRRGLATFWALVPGLLVSLSIEALDLLDDRAFFGYPRWGASLHDLLHTNVAPLVLVLAAKWAGRRRGRRRSPPLPAPRTAPLRRAPRCHSMYAGSRRS